MPLLLTAVLVLNYYDVDDYFLYYSINFRNLFIGVPSMGSVVGLLVGVVGVIVAVLQ